MSIQSIRGLNMAVPASQKRHGRVAHGPERLLDVLNRYLPFFLNTIATGIAQKSQDIYRHPCTFGLVSYYLLDSFQIKPGFTVKEKAAFLS